MGKLEFHKDKNFFMDWMDVNQMSTGEIVLWHTLMSIGNRFGQKNKFSIPTSKLTKQTALSRQGLINARKKLMERGFIQFEKGNKYKTPIYYLNPISNARDDYGNFLMEGYLPRDLTQEFTPNKEEIKKESNSSSCSQREEIIINAYEENIGKLVPMVRDDLLAWLTTYNELIITQAIRETVKRGGKTYNYLEKILKHWKNEGLTTLEEILQHELDKEVKKTKQTFNYKRKVEKEEVNVEISELTLEDLNL